MKAIYIPSFIRETWHNGYTLNHESGCITILPYIISPIEKSKKNSFVIDELIIIDRLCRVRLLPLRGIYGALSWPRGAIPLVDTPEPMDKGLAHDAQPPCRSRISARVRVAGNN